MNMHEVVLCWVPDNSNVEGNEIADELERLGSSMDIGEAVTSLNPTICYFLAMEDCKVIRSIWPGHMVKLNRLNLRSELCLVNMTETNQNTADYVQLVLCN